MSRWDHRMMFERYLYDYLIKNNMQRTAEIFMREANLVLDPTVPTAIDVPDGFLHEWWLVFYDMYRSRNPRDHIPGEGSVMMVEQMIEATKQQTDPTPLRQYSMNERTISHLLTNADSWFNIGVNAMGSRMSPLVIGAEQVPQGISSSSHQKCLLTSTPMSNPPGNLTNLTGQEAASRKADIVSEEEDELIPPPPGFENHALNSTWVTEKHQKELTDKAQLAKASDGESMNTSDSIDGNSIDNNTTLDTSLTKHNCSDEYLKSPSPHVNDNKDTAGSSDKFPECATTADDLTDGILRGSIDANYYFDNSKYAIYSLCAPFWNFVKTPVICSTSVQDSL